jgi:hypothetical protein
LLRTISLHIGADAWLSHAKAEAASSAHRCVRTEEGTVTQAGKVNRLGDRQPTKEG